MNKTISILIPAFNEEKTIARTIQELIDLKLADWNKEIIIVNDGSNDGTEEKIRPFSDQVQLLTHPENRGKGAAIKTALRAASGDVIVIQDADLEYRPSDLAPLLKELDNPTTQVVYGSRNLKPDRRGYPHYVLGVAILTLLTNLLFKSRLTDVYTCYKLFRSDLIKSISLTSCGFEFEAEITSKILKKGIDIKEIPIHYDPRTFSEGKKIRFRDGLIGCWTIVKNYFSSNED